MNLLKTEICVLRQFMFYTGVSEVNALGACITNECSAVNQLKDNFLFNVSIYSTVL